MSTNTIMRYFDHRHLTEGPLRDISREYTEFAEKIDKFLPNGPEKSTALRKLLESKDSAVRSALDIAEAHERAEQTEDQVGRAEESSPVLGETGEQRMDRLIQEKAKENASDNRITVHYDTLPEGVTHSVDGGPFSDQQLREIQRLEARRLNGHS